MSVIDTEERRPALNPELLRDMDRYGIVRVPADVFYYGEFRYTNVDDALAQAKRDADGRKPAGPGLHPGPR